MSVTKYGIAPALEHRTTMQPVFFILRLLELSEGLPVLGTFGIRVISPTVDISADEVRLGSPSIACLGLSAETAVNLFNWRSGWLGRMMAPAHAQ